MTEAEDLKRLAVDVMGWTWDSVDGWRHPDGRCMEWTSYNNGSEDVPVRVPWNPFKDANADVQVLERVREAWAKGRSEAAHRRWVGFDARAGMAADYRIGDYARAALATLDKEP